MPQTWTFMYEPLCEAKPGRNDVIQKLSGLAMAIFLFLHKIYMRFMEWWRYPQLLYFRTFPICTHPLSFLLARNARSTCKCCKRCSQEEVPSISHLVTGASLVLTLQEGNKSSLESHFSKAPQHLCPLKLIWKLNRSIYFNWAPFQQVCFCDICATY